MGVADEPEATAVARTEQHVREELFSDSSGHDWWHVDRVRRLALAISEAEVRSVAIDLHVVELAALLHDISDYKTNGGDVRKGPRLAYDWLVGIGESESVAQHVRGIVAHMSFKGAGVRSPMSSVEGRIVQDADRLDAMGAIGIARAFAFGGYRGELMHDPESSPVLHASHEEYLARRGTTINHFHEKLLLIRDRMNTDTARAIAEKRHAVMVDFLERFEDEWELGDL